MIPTREYIERKFKEYNDEMFGGTLKPLPIRLCRARTFFGQVSFLRQRRLFRRPLYKDFVLKISVSLDMPENVIEDTLIHEMIHYWILSNQMYDTGPHGAIFQKKMREINMRYGRNIEVRHKMTTAEHDRDTEVRRHYVCLSVLRDGRYGITVAMPSSLSSMREMMTHFPDVVSQKWFLSYDVYFNRFRRSKTPKMYIVGKEEIEKYL